MAKVIAGTYNSSQTAKSSGENPSVQTDSYGNILTSESGAYSMSYQAAAGANKVIKATAGYLHAIVVGKDVEGGIIEVSDSATDGDGAVKIYLEDPAVGVYHIGTNFSTGIAVDMTTQTNVTFIYR